MIGYELGESHADGRSMQKEAPRQERLDRGAARIGGGKKSALAAQIRRDVPFKKKGADKAPALILA